MDYLFYSLYLDRVKIIKDDKKMICEGDPPSEGQNANLVDEEFQHQAMRLAAKQDVIKNNIKKMAKQLKETLIMNGTTFHLIKEKQRHLCILQERINALSKSSGKEKSPTQQEIREAVFRNNRNAYLVGSMDPDLCIKKLIEADQLSGEHEEKIKAMQARIKELRSTNKALRLELEVKIKNM